MISINECLLALQCCLKCSHFNMLDIKMFQFAWRGFKKLAKTRNEEKKPREQGIKNWRLWHFLVVFLGVQIIWILPHQQYCVHRVKVSVPFQYESVVNRLCKWIRCCCSYYSFCFLFVRLFVANCSIHINIIKSMTQHSYELWPIRRQFCLSTDYQFLSLQFALYLSLLLIFIFIRVVFLAKEWINALHCISNYNAVPVKRFSY